MVQLRQVSCVVRGRVRVEQPQRTDVCLRFFCASVRCDTPGEIPSPMKGGDSIWKKEL